ncbi:MAG: o-succinylbenzoate synthase [Marinilabiliaceae bacterium]|nr:o-succinylbenzoate synthase [Marinilabiliaceae bacterium]
MRYSYSIEHKELLFKVAARTSRGEYLTHNIWIITINDMLSGRSGTGEAAPLPDLSVDASSNYENILFQFCNEFCDKGFIDYEKWHNAPSMIFAVECALRSINLDCNINSNHKIQINGLIWMGDIATMKRRIDEKLSDNFRCIKIKIGAKGLSFQSELQLLHYLRNNPVHTIGKSVELRLDANGGFSPDKAMAILNELSKFNVHSIEQPIRQGQWSDMRRLCEESPIPIALDEELIGLNKTAEKIEMLNAVKPQFIVIKPTLHGGISGAEEWIRLAEERHIGWWVTSALESNIGLDAIADWISTKNTTMAQGLGTGQLYKWNFQSKWHLKNDELTK